MVTITPGQNIQSIINTFTAETVFQLQNGTHFITTFLTLRSGLTLQGQSQAAILSGGRLLHLSTDATTSGWVQESGGRWSIGNQQQQGSTNTGGECIAGFPECHQSEELWIDGTLQIPQSTLAGVDTTGKWFFDYAANKIYIFGSPANKEVLTSVAQKAIRGNVNNVTVFRLTIDCFAVPGQNAAIQKDDGGTGWTLTELLVKRCHGQAVRLGTNWHLTNSRLTEIGQLGLGGGGNLATGIIADNVEIDHCGVSGINAGFAGGAMKLTNSNGAIVRNSHVHDCPGNGLWWDIDNINLLAQNNIVEDCANQGIFCEIGAGGTNPTAGGRVTGNTVRRCGFGRGNASGFGAGIAIAASGGIEVDNNIVEDCHNGITGIQQNRGAGHVVLNLNVHHNTVTLLQTGGDPQRVGLWVASGFTPDLYAPAANNRFTNNTYNLVGAVSTPFHWNNQNMTLTQWRAAGHDTQVNQIVLAPGQWKYENNTLYVRCTDDSNPSTKKMVVFDQRFGTEEIILVDINGTLIGRLCRHFSYVGDAAGADLDASRGVSMSYDGSRVAFASNRGGGSTGIYVVLTDPRA